MLPPRTVSELFLLYLSPISGESVAGATTPLKRREAHRSPTQPAHPYPPPLLRGCRETTYACHRLRLVVRGPCFNYHGMQTPSRNNKTPPGISSPAVPCRRDCKPRTSRDDRSRTARTAIFPPPLRRRSRTTPARLPRTGVRSWGRRKAPAAGRSRRCHCGSRPRGQATKPCRGHDDTRSRLSLVSSWAREGLQL